MIKLQLNKMVVSILKDEEGTIITNKEKIEKFFYKS
jgi:hypothetical protein